MMDGGFLTFDEILPAQTQPLNVGLAEAEPKFRFDRRSDLTAKARAAAAKAPPGLTLDQIDRVGQQNFQAHHIFPVEAFDDPKLQALIKRLYPEGFDIDDWVVYLPNSPEAVSALAMSNQQPAFAVMHRSGSGVHGAMNEKQNKLFATMVKDVAEGRLSLDEARRQLDDGYKVLVRHSPSGVLSDARIAEIFSLDKRLLPRAASAVARAAETGRIRPRSHRVLARRWCFSAGRADLSCRFRSV